MLPVKKIPPHYTHYVDPIIIIIRIIIISLTQSKLIVLVPDFAIFKF